MPRALLILTLVLVIVLPVAWARWPAPSAPHQARLAQTVATPPRSPQPTSSPPAAVQLHQTPSLRPEPKLHRLQWRTGQPIHWVDGRPVLPAKAPVIRRGRSLVPAPELAEALGARLQYNSTTRQTSFRLGERRVVLYAESISEGVPWVPLRRVAEGLGGQVAWDGRLGVVTVTLREQP